MACPRYGMMFALERAFVDLLRRNEVGAYCNDDRSDYTPGEASYPYAVSRA